jgi:hypothetical protein
LGFPFHSFLFSLVSIDSIGKNIIFFLYFIMTRYSKDASGAYIIKGVKYEMLVGSRAQVGHGTAYKTSGGLTKSDLLKNKSGRFVSKKKYFTAKKERRLAKAGYIPKKGVFGVSKSTRKRRGSRKNKRGGGDCNSDWAKVK